MAHCFNALVIWIVSLIVHFRNWRQIYFENPLADFNTVLLNSNLCNALRIFHQIYTCFTSYAMAS